MQIDITEGNSKPGKLGVGLHWERVSYIIRDKKQGGSLEVTIQDINADRHY